MTTLVAWEKQKKVLFVMERNRREIWIETVLNDYGFVRVKRNERKFNSCSAEKEERNAAKCVYKKRFYTVT